MLLLVVPIGVTVHSVVSWIFGLTFRAGWDSTIFAPYFAVGALYSGTAMLITLMIITRRFFHLEEYFEEKHFRYLSYMLAVFGIVYLYFTFAEYLTVAYKLQSNESLLLQELLIGRYAFLVWPGFVGGQILPILVALCVLVPAIGGGVRGLDRIGHRAAILRHALHAIGIDHQRLDDDEIGLAPVPFRRKHREVCSLIAVVGAGGHQHRPGPARRPPLGQGEIILHRMGRRR
jgi:hypothetical protein